MKSQPLEINGALLLTSEPYQDARGAFEVFWESSEFKSRGGEFAPISACHSYNDRRGTLRGMHYQKGPHGQAKLVTCVAGKVFDVMVDLRPESPSYLRWLGLELTEKSGVAVFVPAGCAHGFQTLAPDTTVAYLIEGGYVPEAACILRWDDPAIGIRWPLNDPVLSERDRVAPDFRK